MSRPNVIIILNDDMGYSDIGCYGGEVETPHLDRLAAGGIRFSQFYNTARCSPSRASLLTGLHPHQTGIGILTDDDGPDGYPGNLNRQCVTIAELLQQGGYRTYMSGKWHLANDIHNENHTWPLQRGFDRFYGTLAGAGSYFRPMTLMRDNEHIDGEELPENYYYTDAISAQAASFVEDHNAVYPDRPFFMYVAYTAPHWPLHAKEEDISKYKGRFDAGWDALRERRLARLKSLGIISEETALSERDSSLPDWERAEHKEYLLRCMEAYAAQIDAMDQGIGRLVDTLERTGQLDNTLLFFLSDNGGCAEVIQPEARIGAEKKGVAPTRTRNGKEVAFGNDPTVMPGAEGSYQSYGVAWANLSNTPFRLYKHWVHEGGIATPFIAHWPERIRSKGDIVHTPWQLTDVLPTVLEVSGTSYPDAYRGNALVSPEGESFASLFDGDVLARGPLYWEHEGNAAVRMLNWKLVKKHAQPWELYDMNEDRTEQNDLAEQHPDFVAELSMLYDEWALRCGVIPREQILKLKKSQSHQ
ncbi:arylsulfatase [Paenibacillus sp. HB172176]|uniref:arylsulfatase n=1 Tax=Paenibacillus sp. HB172176 TaxID=2493690 RepID=UPI00143B6075|nr:arylsulfatase [Paenibacillus sp. HB172176]